MDLEDLREARRRERQRDSLQPLEDSFYRDAAAYIAERKADRDRLAERADDPYGDPEIRQLTDEIETAEEVVEALYERRIGKVVKHASFAAADMQHDDEGLTDEERDLFDDLVARIRSNRERVLDHVAEPSAADAGSSASTDADADTDAATETPAPGEPTDPAAPDDPTPSSTGPSPDPTPADAGSAPTDADESTDEAPPDPNDLLAEAMGDDESRPDGGAVRARDGGSPTEPGAVDGRDAADEEPPDDDGDADGSGVAFDRRETVRITASVGEIYGVDDRAYDLDEGDVVTLPEPNAAPLVDSDAAERL